MGKLFYIMGKSASGKDTVYGKVIQEFSELTPLVLYTTRPIREGEENGKDYYFVTREEMFRLEEAGKVIERRTYHTVHGEWDYFTVDAPWFNLTEHSYVGIGTLESYNKLRAYYAEELLVPIYIEVEDGVRLERALMRERKQAVPKYEEMCRRFLADAKDFSEENLIQAGIDKRIENTDFEQCLAEVFLYIRGKM